MRRKGQTEEREAVDHALAVPKDYGTALVQDEILHLMLMPQSRKGRVRVPTGIKEPLSELQGALWVWLGQDGGLGAKEWGEGRSSKLFTTDVFSRSKVENMVL